MIILGIVILCLITLAVYSCLAMSGKNAYDRLVNDQEQERYLAEWVKAHQHDV